MTQQNKCFKKTTRVINAENWGVGKVRSLFAVMIFFVLVLSGCSRQITLSKAEVNAIWQLYYAREFTESLEEKLSSEQRKEIIKALAAENRLDYAQIMVQLRNNDPDRFEKLFY